MNTFLVVDKLSAPSGVYGIEPSNDLIRLIFGIDALYFYGKYLKLLNFPNLGQKLMRNRLKKIRDLESGEKSIGVKQSGKFLDEAILIYSENLNNRFDKDDKIFDGVFKKNEQLKEILPQNRNAELIVITKDSATKYFPKTENISLGLNVLSEDDQILIPLKEYTNTKWSNLTTNICHIFPFLGAKRIKIKDCTDSTLKAEVNLVAKATKLGLSGCIKRKFEIEEIFKDSIYDPAVVKDKLFMLIGAPHIRQKAIDLINRKRTGTLIFTEIVDLSFGLSIDTLVSFQGVFEGGYSREFNVEIDFE